MSQTPVSSNDMPDTHRNTYITYTKSLIFIALAVCALCASCRDTTGVDNPPHPESTAEVPAIEHMIGQMIMVGFRGLSVSNSADTVGHIQQGLIGGVILFDRDVAGHSDTRNISNRKQIKELTSSLQSLAAKSPPGLPLLIAVDQEGGRVARLKVKHGFTQFPSADELGQSKDLHLTRTTAKRIAIELSHVGINLNLAPVLDVNTNPDNPAIGRLGRSFSEHPQVVATHGIAYINGLHDAGILACAKHFPGHGSAYNDSHLGLTDITDTWQRNELRPFAAAIEAGVCDMVMTGHLFNAHLDPTYPATLSKATITGLLRGQLEFDGVVITDDMQMGAIRQEYTFAEAARLAILAGADILLYGNNLVYDEHLAERLHATILAMVDRGQISRERITRSYRRIVSLKRRLQASPSAL